MPDVFVPTTTPNVTSHGVPVSTPQPSSVLPLKKAMPLLSMLCRNPEGVSFANQDADEHVVLFLRRHVITNIPWIITAIVLLLLPPFSPLILLSLAITPPVIPLTYMIVTTILYYFFLLGFILYQFMNWFYNISIVSNKKVVDVDYNRITAKDVSTATLDAVEDATYVQNGFIKTQFNFGTVEVLTQSVNKEILFEDVPRPADVTAVIIDLKGGITEP